MTDEQSTVPTDEQQAGFAQSDATAPVSPAPVASDAPSAAEGSDLSGYVVTSYTMPVPAEQATTPMPDPIPAPQPTAPLPDYQQQASSVGYQQAPSAGYQQAAPVPPVAPVPPTADPYQAAAPQPQPAPQYQQVAALSQLTGGMKFCWLCIGLLMNIPGLLLAWLVNVDKHPQVKKDAIMWAVIGFAINIVFGIIITIAFTGLIATAISSAGNGYYGGYYF